MSPVTLIAIAATSLAGAGLVAYWMWDTAQIPPTTSPQPIDLLVRKTQLRVDLIRNLLGIFAGTGGLIALFIAIRRQYVQERVDHRDQELKEQAAADSKHDADERRLTELYVKAAEQLGSEKAPVRLAALYSLERIGQGNSAQRQTIANIICAYLRMPYKPPEEPRGIPLGSPELRAEERRRRLDEDQRRREEREVRLTAQAIINRRLFRRILIENVDDDSRWDVSLDLSYATLIDFDLSNCTANLVDLRGARLTGTTRLYRFECEGGLIAHKATFEGAVSFRDARVVGHMNCKDTVFHGSADFGGLVLAGEAFFNRARFDLGVSFDRGKGLGSCYFDGATVKRGQKAALPAGWKLGKAASEGSVTIVKNAGRPKASPPAD